MIRRIAAAFFVAVFGTLLVVTVHGQSAKVGFAEVMKYMQKCNVDGVRQLITGVAPGQPSTGQATADPSLIASPDGVPLIVAAAATDCVEGVHELLNDGAEVSATDAQGNTPLHAAAASSKSAMVQLLVDKGANVNAANAKGETPLTAAQTNNYKGKTDERDKIVAYLKKKGAK